MTLWIDRDAVQLHLRALFVGQVVGISAVMFHACLDQGETLRDRLRHACLDGGWQGMAVWLAVVTAAISLAAWLVRQFAPEASGSGISNVESVLRDGHQIRWQRVPIIKFISGVLGIGGAGLALGREGPTVQMGASIGEMSASPTRESRLDLIAIGAGAGLTAAFNAPLSGMIFAFEELRVGFRPALGSAALLAVVVADTVVRMTLGARPELGARELAVNPIYLPWYVVLGVVAGLLAVVFNTVLIASLRGCRWLARHVSPWVIPAVVGVLVGITAWYHPDWVGGGGKVLVAALGGQEVLATAGILLAVRFVLTIGSYSAGSAGGIFAPLLLLGALVGLLFAAAIQPLTGPLATPAVTAFALAAMTGLFSGVVRAPLTGVLLMVEMARAYDLLLPLLLVALLAKWTADALGSTPVYEALREL